jgi:hypothetical protein
MSSGRDHIKTAEFATAFSRATQTIRKQYAETGQCYGIKPRKVGNFLLWPVADIAAKLEVGAK